MRKNESQKRATNADPRKKGADPRAAAVVYGVSQISSRLALDVFGLGTHGACRVTLPLNRLAGEDRATVRQGLAFYARGMVYIRGLSLYQSKKMHSPSVNATGSVPTRPRAAPPALRCMCTPYYGVCAPPHCGVCTPHRTTKGCTPDDDADDAGNDDTGTNYPPPVRRSFRHREFVPRNFRSTVGLVPTRSFVEQTPVLFISPMIAVCPRQYDFPHDSCVPP